MKNSNLNIEKDFSQLFDEHWHKLYAYAFNILKDKQAAEDCVQNVFVAIWRKVDTTEILNVKAYLYQAVKYQCAKVLSSQKRFNYALDPEHLTIASSPFEIEKTQKENELLKKVYEHIGQLPEKCQRVFCSSRFEKKSNKEIAAELGISVSTVENHINKALKLLRSAMPEHLLIFMILVFN